MNDLDPRDDAPEPAPQPDPSFAEQQAQQAEEGRGDATNGEEEDGD